MAPDAAYRIAGLPDELGWPDALLADAGYFSEANVEACAKADVDPFIARGRDAHYPGVDERFTPAWTSASPLHHPRSTTRRDAASL